MAAMSKGSSDTDQRTVLTIVRHGQSMGNDELRFGGHAPTALSEHGLRQARVTGEALARGEPPTTLVSSDLPRAWRTAEEVSRATDATPVPEPGLRERCLGELDGMRFDAVAERYPERWKRLRAQDPTFRPPGGGETIDEVYERVSATIDRLASEHRGGHVVAVSHALAIFHVFAHICGLGSPSQGLQVFMLVDNCSLSTFVLRRGRWRIMAINDCAHLGELTTREPYPA
ncbi:MAG: histidine phosphatase family protein [Planctomycetota bacterium]|jgi:probable phosphoglycerate mutase